MYEQSSKKIDSYFKEFFKDNIIKGYSKGKMYDDLLDRVRFKKAPFFNQENSSDKGFKDTLMWMSILNYIDKSDFLEFNIVTNDKGFLTKQKESLIKEFSSRFPDKTLNIISNNEFIKNRNNGEDGLEIDDKDDNPIINDKQTSVKKISEELIQVAKESVVALFYYTVYGNPYEFEQYDDNRFVLSKRPNFNEVVEFVDSLNDMIDDFTFHDYIDVQKILIDMGFQYVKQREGIPRMVLKQFTNIFLEIKNVYPASFDALVQLCIDNFCEIKDIGLEPEDELPF